MIKIEEEEIIKGIDKAYKKAGHNAYFGNGFYAGVDFVQKQLPINSVRDLFSFTKYLNKHFKYFDNLEIGDVYKDNNGEGFYTEEDIFDEWLNNR